MTEGYKSITGLVDVPASGDLPQFAKVQADPHAGVRLCSACRGVIIGQAHVVSASLLCSKCARAVAAGAPADSHAAYARSLVCGAAAAFVGLALYAAFTIFTHFYFGLIAFAVGWMVGKAMIFGSGGVGGQRYQVAAAVLTYLSISLASVPILLSSLLSHGMENVAWGPAIGQILLWGIASPLLAIRSGMSGIIGLIILFAGLRIAWRITAARAVVEPPRTIVAS